MIKCEIYHNRNKTNLDSSTLRSSSLTHFCHASHVGSYASHAFVQQIHKSVQPVQHSATATISITAVSGKVLLLACHRAKMTTGLRLFSKICEKCLDFSSLTKGYPTTLESIWCHWGHWGPLAFLPPVGKLRRRVEFETSNINGSETRINGHFVEHEKVMCHQATTF